MSRRAALTNLPVEAYYFMAGGIAYLIIKDVFSFVKVIIGKINGNGKVNGDGGRAKANGQILTALKLSIDDVIVPRLSKVENTVDDLSKTFTHFVPLYESIEKKMCSMSKSLTQLSRDFEATRRDCSSRFARLEVMANSSRRRKNGGQEK